MTYLMFTLKYFDYSSRIIRGSLMKKELLIIRENDVIGAIL